MVRPTKFEIQCAAYGSTVTLSIRGELDMQTVQTLSRRVADSLTGEVTDLTLNLHDLAFMDSTGLKFLIEINDRSQQEGWRLKLVAPEHEGAVLVLRATGADIALPFQRDSDA